MVTYVRCQRKTCGQISCQEFRPTLFRGIIASGDREGVGGGRRSSSVTLTLEGLVDTVAALPEIQTRRSMRVTDAQPENARQFAPYRVRRMLSACRLRPQRRGVVAGAARYCKAQSRSRRRQ